MFDATAARSSHMPQTRAVEIRIHRSIAEIAAPDWDACFPGNPEGHAYLLATERAGIEGFGWRYLTAQEGGRIIAAMPAFLTDYALETTVDNPRLRGIVARIRKSWRRFLVLKLACLGSPCTETGRPGFHPLLDEARRPTLMAQLIAAFEAMAKAEGCALRGLKDMPETELPALRPVIDAAGYAALPGLATAWLDIDFDSEDDYLAQLSARTRKDMRRKLKSRAQVSVEHVTDLAPVLDRYMALYNATRDRSDWQFEALTADYFTAILRDMPGRSFCTLYRVEGRLLAANFFVANEDVLIDKFFCMDAEEGRAYNLYYLSWFNNIAYCLEHGIARYQSGQAYYDNKLRLGSQLTANFMFFRHRNPILQRVLRWVSPLFAIEESAEKSE
ncbi:peptidogalycan biosysnthesis protein [Paracoccus aminophilus]|nr:peptidogalycan biosysnthesis protein [Paracoccus aminophilus]